jgi:hypothetical protein
MDELYIEYRNHGRLYQFSVEQYYNPVQKILENAFFRSFSVICELFFPLPPYQC